MIMSWQSEILRIWYNIMHYQIHEKLTKEEGVLEQAVIGDSKDTLQQGG